MFMMIDDGKIKEVILYRSDTEKKAARRKIIEEAIVANASWQDYSVDRIEQLLNCPDLVVNGTKDYEVAHDCSMIICMDENTKVFQMACDRLGYKLWNGRAWQNKTCKRNCPLADYCQKATVAINGERLCRGQVYSRGINSEKAEQLPNDTPIYKADGSACYLKSDDPEAFGNFFEILFEVGYNYGDPKRAGNRLMGGNVIWQLYKTALNAKGEH